MSEVNQSKMLINALLIFKNKIHLKFHSCCSLSLFQSEVCANLPVVNHEHLCLWSRRLKYQMEHTQRVGSQWWGRGQDVQESCGVKFKTNIHSAERNVLLWRQQRLVFTCKWLDWSLDANKVCPCICVSIHLHIVRCHANRNRQHTHQTCRGS